MDHLYPFLPLEPSLNHLQLSLQFNHLFHRSPLKRSGRFGDERIDTQDQFPSVLLVSSVRENLMADSFGEQRNGLHILIGLGGKTNEKIAFDLEKTILNQSIDRLSISLHLYNLSSTPFEAFPNQPQAQWPRFDTRLL